MAKLSPIILSAQFINGIPASGAKLFSYAAGSSTKQTTYTGADGLTPQTNPIILDSRGEPSQPIWLTEGLSYKFVFTASTDSDPPVSPIWDVDNVTGINDASLTIDQWIISGVTPTYVSATQFTLPGDQTTAFEVGRRIKATVTAGTVYGTITASVFGALTTVTVSMDGSSVLDSGLSAVSYGIITSSNSSLPYGLSAQAIQKQTFEAFATGGTSTAYTLTPFPALTSLTNYHRFNVIPNATAGATPTLAISGLTAKSIKQYDSTGAKVAVSASTFISGVIYDIEYDGTDYVVLNPLPATTPTAINVRQTVLNGTVDTNGASAFGGSTGSGTVTTSTTLVATAANGVANRTASITNPSWTGLTTNGTMYLYLDIDANLVATTGSTTLLPTYRWGGADVVTNNQFTFNIQEMTGKVGNGSVATQTYRVFVGEVTVAGSVVTVITWYALMGRYTSPDTAIPAGNSPVTVNHNIGVTPLLRMGLKNAVTDSGYAVGDIVPIGLFDNATIMSTPSVSRLSAQHVSNASNSYRVGTKTTGAVNTITAANWRYVFTCERGW